MTDSRQISFSPPKGGLEEASVAPCSGLKRHHAEEGADLLCEIAEGRTRPSG